MCSYAISIQLNWLGYKSNDCREKQTTFDMGITKTVQNNVLTQKCRNNKWGG